MSIIIGSARSDENGNLSGGKAGDQKQKKTDDYTGEVSLQEMYVHKKGWYIIRPKDDTVASKLSKSMKTACNNKNIGYNQAKRNDIIKVGTATKEKTSTDCSALVRCCVKEATGKDPGSFTTANEKTILQKSGYFNNAIAYKSQKETPVYNGDVLVTKTKGHTVIVVSGSPRGVKSTSIKYYPIYLGHSTSIVDALASVGESDTGISKRKKIAKANGFTGYTGKTSENTRLLYLLKHGKLIRV